MKINETTDIAALMLKMRNLADRIIDAEGENNNGEVGKIIEMYDAADTTFKAENILLVLSAFEEQRQRADANAQEIRRLEFQWEHRAPTEWAYDQACTALHAQRERAEVAGKERDTLKSAHGNMVARCALLRQRTDLPVDRIPAYNSLVKAQEEVTELREKLANPVVLPAGYSTRAGHPFHEGERNVMIPNKHGDWLSRFDVEHAIHVAGFPFTVEGE